MATSEDMKELNDGIDAVFDTLERWEPIHEEDYDPEVLCAKAIAPADAGGPAVHCEQPVTRVRYCSSCDSYELRCAVHGVDSMTDFDMARFKKQLLPLVIRYANEAGQIERHARAAEAHRRQAFNALGDQMYFVLMQLVGAEKTQKAIDKVLKLDDTTITLTSSDGVPMTQFPRGFLPGETPLDIVKQFCRVVVEMLAGAGQGMSYGIEKLRQEHRPTVLVQCDDFAPAEQAHHALVAKIVQVGTAAELAALNEALRLCARPARAFRAGDHLEAYVTDGEHHHDHGAS